MTQSATLNLAHGLVFADLYARDGLVKLDSAFVAYLQTVDAELFNRLMAARATPGAIEDKDESTLIIDLAPHLEDFIGGLFGIQDELRALAVQHDALAPLYEVKRLFVQRRAVKRFKPDELAALEIAPIEAALITKLAAPITEETFAAAVLAWQKDEAANEEGLDLAKAFAAWATLHPDGQARFAAGVLFKVPKKLDFQHLVPVETELRDGVTMIRLSPHHWRQRQGFALTDAGMDLKAALDQANYCIFCHNQGKDSCSKGLKERKTGAYQKSPFGVTLVGCPLEEKISEMNSLKSAGYTLGALAVVVIDNPMTAGTGHRICNDCMKSCIYQKQEPVNIPQVETRTLKDVLALPWGFELYSLLTRWNPLNIQRPLPKADAGYKVLVVGLGPAGYTLAHHLMNDGHTVVAVDGLKIEPLPEEISGVALDGARVPFKPIRDIAELTEPLSDRAMAGFGGVAEYGITVRWDKNFLKIVRLLLERRASFVMFGGVRFGGTLTIKSTLARGFDHIALCVGAGRPTFIEMPNALARGVRQASDFLMGLQLTGAAKPGSPANLQLRLPVVVIGGGLTAIDTATESLAYYPVQVEKFLVRFETLVAERSEAKVRAAWNLEDTLIADEFLAHAKAIRAERAAATSEKREANLIKLLRSWGGATLAYRRRMTDSPSYTLNHEEVEKAMEEGIDFAEGLSPVEIEVDEFGHARAMTCARMEAGDDGRLVDSGKTVQLPARSVLIAAGTQPNTVLAREDAAHMMLDGKYFRALDEDGAPATPEKLAKPEQVRVLTAIEPDGRAISFFGDLHPSFAGNVVKAMGSAKQGYPVVSRVLAKRAPTAVKPADLVADMNRALRATVHAVNRLTPTIIEVVVHAPLAAKNFEPGQFYRLQNFESLAPRIDGTVLSMEGLAMTGAWVDRDKGLISIIVLEMGGSSDLCASLKTGEPVVLMGPTGSATETPPGETVLLVGGGLGNAVLFSIGQALRAAGSKVLYFAGYKKLIDRYKVEQIEEAADVVVWCSDEGPGFEPTRTEDKRFVGNIVEAMVSYGSGALGDIPIKLDAVNRIIAIGSDGMMAAVGRSRHTVLKPYLRPDHQAFGSINSPMQCMMKEICAQCLQTHTDPLTGKSHVVFSCSNQDQPLDVVDFRSLRERLGQNRAQEKLTAQWIDRCLKRLNLRATAAE